MLRSFARKAVLKVCPPIARLVDRARNAERKSRLFDALVSRLSPSSAPEALLAIARNGSFSVIGVDQYDDFAFQNGDLIEVVPILPTANIVQTPDGNKHLMSKNGPIRIPPKMEQFEYRGTRLPCHLVILTGAGPDSWEQIGKGHIDSYLKFMGIDKGMTFLEIGCGIGRDAFQLESILGPSGKYIGIDVTRDSIVWLQKNITRMNPNFEFHHFDAQHELYNPLGKKTSLDFRLPAADKSVDAIALGSIFTHLFEDEVRHYLKEIKRVLKPGGLCYATFFLYSDETISAARKTKRSHNNLMFEHPYGNGCYINDKAYPTGAVAFTNDKMMAMINDADLKLARPYLKGWWSGAYEKADDGQDVALLTPAN